MTIDHDSEDLLFVQMPAGQTIHEELGRVIELAKNRGTCDVIIDFSRVDLVNPPTLSALLRLGKLLCVCDRKLVFCNVRPCTEKIFSLTGLLEVFDCAGSRSEAFTTLRAD